MASVASDDIDILAKARRSLDSDYTPSDDEEYMSDKQMEYFRMLLVEWKKSILSAAEGTLQSLQDGPIREPDLNDRASSETDWGIELQDTRPPAQADRQDRFRAAPDRQGGIRLLRSHRRPDRAQAPDRPPDRHHDGRSAGSA